MDAADDFQYLVFRQRAFSLFEQGILSVLKALLSRRVNALQQQYLNSLLGVRKSAIHREPDNPLLMFPDADTNRQQMQITTGERTDVDFIGFSNETPALAV